MLYYDFHIHSALSPCADSEMTPNNIINMSVLKGLDAIAVADHNSCANLKAVMQAAEGRGIIVVPAIEVESAEEVHLLCLFSDFEGACEVGAMVGRSLIGVKNRPEIFGEQLVMDSSDNITGRAENLLITACTMPIRKIKHEVEKRRGICIPAHIDKDSQSIISNLGFIDDQDGYTTLEISKKADYTEYSKKYPKYNIIVNSDAHCLGDISEREHFLDADCRTAAEIVKILSKKFLKKQKK